MKNAFASLGLKAPNGGAPKHTDNRQAGHPSALRSSWSTFNHNVESSKRAIASFLVPSSISTNANPTARSTNSETTSIPMLQSRLFNSTQSTIKPDQLSNSNDNSNNIFGSSSSSSSSESTSPSTSSSSSASSSSSSSSASSLSSTSTFPPPPSSSASSSSSSSSSSASASSASASSNSSSSTDSSATASSTSADSPVIAPATLPSTVPSSSTSTGTWLSSVMPSQSVNAVVSLFRYKPEAAPIAFTNASDLSIDDSLQALRIFYSHLNSRLGLAILRRQEAADKNSLSVENVQDILHHLLTHHQALCSSPTLSEKKWLANVLGQGLTLSSFPSIRQSTLALLVPLIQSEKLYVDVASDSKDGALLSNVLKVLELDELMICRRLAADVLLEAVQSPSFAPVVYKLNSLVTLCKVVAHEKDLDLVVPVAKAVAILIEMDSIAKSRVFQLSILTLTVPSVLNMMKSHDLRLFHAGCRLLAVLARNNDSLRDTFYNQGMAYVLMDTFLAAESDHPAEYLWSNIDALSELCFYDRIRKAAWDKQSIVPKLHHVSQQHQQHKELVKTAAKTLALLGDNGIGPSSSIKGRKGLRILSMDGGGTRGLVIIEMLKHLTASTGRPVHELFDIICGTSTGGILAVALGVKRKSLQECEELYKQLSSKIFQKTFAHSGKMLLTRAKYDSLMLEATLDEYLGLDRMIEGAGEYNCAKVFVISTLVSRSPARVFLFRNYKYHPAAMFKSRYLGSCRYRMWEALRASTAAPSFFTEFVGRNKEIFQDGALLANNPTGVAIHEARVLFPNMPIECIVSLGTGARRANDVESIGWAATIGTLVWGATNTETVHTMLDDLLPPHVYFRFNPSEIEAVELDESRADKLEQVQEAARQYIAANQAKFTEITQILNPAVRARKGSVDSIVDKVKTTAMSLWTSLLSASKRSSTPVHDPQAPGPKVDVSDAPGASNVPIVSKL